MEQGILEHLLAGTGDITHPLHLSQGVECWSKLSKATSLFTQVAHMAAGVLTMEEPHGRPYLLGRES